MAVPITVPRLGWTMEEGAFVGWLKADGAEVRPGEPLFSLEGEKATEAIECLEAGILRIPPDGPRAGASVRVGAVIGYVVRPGEAAPWEGGGAGDKEIGRQGEESAPPCLPASLAPGPSLSLRSESTQPAISPRARRAARELGIDWTKLHGSGRTGRIRERDVRAAASREDTAVPLSAVRQTTAARLLHSHLSTAPVTLTTMADARNLVNLRQQFKAAAGEEPVPGYTDFLVKLTAEALRQHPALNAVWADDRIIVAPAIHIGIAVDTEKGLLVPVLRDVPSLGLKQLAAQARALVDRARQGKLAAEDMAGGTFTLTNLGAFGIDAFTPLINYPQCAILGVGRIERRPAVRGGRIVAREQVTLSLTFDHRMVDGAPAARFLQTLVRLIENPCPWLMP